MLILSWMCRGPCSTCLACTTWEWILGACKACTTAPQSIPAHAHMHPHSRSYGADMGMGHHGMLSQVMVQCNTLSLAMHLPRIVSSLSYAQAASQMI